MKAFLATVALIGVIMIAISVIGLIRTKHESDILEKAEQQAAMKLLPKDTTPVCWTKCNETGKVFIWNREGHIIDSFQESFYEHVTGITYDPIIDHSKIPANEEK